MNPPKNHFADLIFTNFTIRPFCIVLIINSWDFIFMNFKKIAKTAKVIGLESFRLYGIYLLQTIMAVPDCCMHVQK